MAGARQAWKKEANHYSLLTILSPEEYIFANIIVRPHEHVQLKFSGYSGKPSYENIFFTNARCTII